MNSYQIQRQRENDLAENMIPEQIEQQHIRHLVDIMTPERSGKDIVCTT